MQRTLGTIPATQVGFKRPWVKATRKGEPMFYNQLFGRASFLKKRLQHLLDRIVSARRKASNNVRSARVISPSDIVLGAYHYETHRTDNSEDDLALTLNREDRQGVRYGYTENSEFARGAEKAPAFGIDHFGDHGGPDPETAFVNPGIRPDLDKPHPQ
jgi:hypothetical protein